MDFCTLLPKIVFLEVELCNLFPTGLDISRRCHCHPAPLGLLVYGMTGILLIKNSAGLFVVIFRAVRNQYVISVLAIDIQIDHLPDEFPEYCRFTYSIPATRIEQENNRRRLLKIMEHGPPTEWQEDKSEGFKTKLGLIMVTFFTIVYFAFIILAVTNPQAMANDVGSLNVAVVYGFGIIILAIIQALIYNFVCSRHERSNGDSGHDKGETD